MTVQVELQGSPYRFPLLHTLFDLLELLLQPFLKVLDQVCGPYFPTTKELAQPNVLRFHYLISILCIPIVLILFPPAAPMFCLKWVIHQMRLPYFLSINTKMASKLKDETEFDSNKFTVATMNVCLLPECMAKFNNLSDTKTRARIMGAKICSDQNSQSDLFPQANKESICDGKITRHTGNGTRARNASVKRNGAGDVVEPLTAGDGQTLEFNILTNFRKTDIICLQETFDRRISHSLVEELHKVYPWIVSDVGFTGPRENKCGLNSGLMVASRYEITDVDFKSYEAKCGFSYIMNRGLLMVKLLLEQNGETSRVGYIFNTHLQAFQGDQPIIQRQLSDMEAWTEQFWRETSRPHDIVVFDIVCGDFNIDNMSPGEAHLATHNLFNRYIDVCRERPGKDYDWTIGTELRTPRLHDADISSPDGLKSSLEDPYRRQMYVIDADIQNATMDTIYNPSIRTDEHGNVVLSPVGGRRRIDAVLYRKTNPLIVTNYNLVTSLAPHTDHVPVSLTFKCA